MHQIAVSYPITSIFRDVIFTIFLVEYDSKRFLVDSWASTMHGCFVFRILLDSSLLASGFPQLLLAILCSHLATHRRLNRNLQLFPWHFFYGFLGTLHLPDR